jgi:hypothetical protein
MGSSPVWAPSYVIGLQGAHAVHAGADTSCASPERFVNRSGHYMPRRAENEAIRRAILDKVLELTVEE